MAIPGVVCPIRFKSSFVVAPRLCGECCAHMAKVMHPHTRLAHTGEPRLNGLPESRGFESRHSPQGVRGCFRPLTFFFLEMPCSAIATVAPDASRGPSQGAASPQTGRSADPI